MNDINIFFKKFLEIIDYPDDKQEFINKFTATIYLEAVRSLLSLLSEEKQSVIKQQLNIATTPEAITEVVKNNFEKKAFEEALKTASQKVFADYTQTISEILSDEQKTKLQLFFSSITKT